MAYHWFFLCVCVCSRVMMLFSSSSLLVEPKQPADTIPMSDMRQLFNWATRSQSTAAAAVAATMIQWKWSFECLSLCAKWWWYSQDGSFFTSLRWIFLWIPLLPFLSRETGLLLIYLFYTLFPFFFEKTKPWTISSRYRHLFDFWLLFF